MDDHHTAPRVPWVVAVTGASGTPYAAAVIRGLLDADQPVDLVVSKAARLTMLVPWPERFTGSRRPARHLAALSESPEYTQYEGDPPPCDAPHRTPRASRRTFPATALDETGLTFREARWEADVKAFLGRDPGDMRVWKENDFTAGPASGSYRTRGMVIVPATTAVVAGVATGMSKDLVQRAADVTLKERRRLVIVLREAPLRRVTLQQLADLSGEGAVILPASPGFYAGGQDVQELIDFVAGKVLDVIDVPHTLYTRWSGTLGAARAKARDGGPDPRPDAREETPDA